MSKVQVFDPPTCCSTGVCGPEVEPALVRFASDLESLKSNGVAVERFNQEPADTGKWYQRGWAAFREGEA